MRIAIFENEYDTVEIAFKYLNKKFYNKTLEFKNYQRSQDITDINELNLYRLIIIDIDLSAASDLDGFGLIRKIEQEIDEPPQILIMTGQELEDDYHTQNGLSQKYSILEKSINYNKLFDVFQELGITV